MDLVCWLAISMNRTMLAMITRERNDGSGFQVRNEAKMSFSYQIYLATGKKVPSPNLLDKVLS